MIEDISFLYIVLLDAFSITFSSLVSPHFALNVSVSSERMLSEAKHT